MQKLIQCFFIDIVKREITTSLGDKVNENQTDRTFSVYQDA
jgi:hypothetical protein